jgi:hypothetical protein
MPCLPAPAAQQPVGSHGGSLKFGRAGCVLENLVSVLLQLSTLIFPLVTRAVKVLGSTS